MKKYLIAAIILILAIAGVTSVITYQKTDSYKLQKEIADNLIRFHVRANSDSEEDQSLKLKVKDKVVEYMEKELAGVSTLDEARNIIYYDMSDIKAIALDEIVNEGYEYDVDVYFERSYFPMKTYGDMCFPPGEYEAFRIDIGGAAGRNWWCVLFPPLCFVDSTYAVVPEESKAQFKSVLSDDAYNAIIDDDDSSYEFRFKYLTFLNKLVE